jgi:hypothetical protein
MDKKKLHGLNFFLAIQFAKKKNLEQELSTHMNKRGQYQNYTFAFFSYCFANFGCALSAYKINY